MNLKDNEKEIAVRVNNFFSNRCIKIDGKLMITADNLTRVALIRDLTKTDEEYYDYDDFRSRA